MSTSRVTLSTMANGDSAAIPPCNHRNQRSTVSFYVQQANGAGTVFQQHQRLIGTEKGLLYMVEHLGGLLSILV